MHGDPFRRRELSLAGALRPETANERAIDVEYLHAVVARVGDGDRMIAAHGNPGRRRELSLAGALRPEHEGGLAVNVEDLHAVVARVGDGDHPARRNEGNGAGPVKLPYADAGRAELAGKCAVDKDLHAVVARVGDGDRAIMVHGDPFRRRELSLAGALRPEGKGGHAIGMKDPYRVIGRVGNGDHVGAQARSASGLGMRYTARHGRGNGRQQPRGDNGGDQQKPETGHAGTSNRMYIIMTARGCGWCGRVTPARQAKPQAQSPRCRRELRFRRLARLKAAWGGPH